MAALDLTQLMQRFNQAPLTDENGQITDPNSGSDMDRLRGLYSQYQNIKQLGNLSNIGKYGVNTAEYTDPATGMTHPVQYYVEGDRPGEYRVNSGGGVGSRSTQGDSNTFAGPGALMGLGQVGDGTNAFVTALGNTPAFRAPAPDETGGFGSQLTSFAKSVMQSPVGMAIGAAYLPGLMAASNAGTMEQFIAESTASGALPAGTTAAQVAAATGTDAATYAANAAARANYLSQATDVTNSANNLTAQVGGVKGNYPGPGYTPNTGPASFNSMFPDYANAGYDIPAASSAEAAAAGAGAVATGGSWMDSLLASAGKFGSTLMSAPVVGAGISTLGALYGASQIGKSATNAANTLGAANTNAANLASNASLAATNLQREQFQRQQELQQPFYNAGVNALPAYASGVMPGGSLVKPFSMADYQADPGYGFRFDQGMKALNSSMASRGLGVSGPSIKGAINFGQGAASQEYQNAYNRYVNDQSTQRNALAGLTGYGPTAASTIGAAGQNYASNVGNMGMTTANTIGGMGTNTASQIANADLTGAAARQSAYGGSANAFNAALNPNPLNAFLARSIGNPYG